MDDDLLRIDDKLRLVGLRDPDRRAKPVDQVGLATEMQAVGAGNDSALGLEPLAGALA